MDAAGGGDGHKTSHAVRFADFDSGLDAVRAITQSGLHPANCRLLDPGEVLFSGAAAGGQSVLVLGFESATGPLDTALTCAVEIAICARRNGAAARGG